MAEREPVPVSQLDEQAIATALRTRPATVRDVAYGEGHQFSAGRGSVRIELFPQTGVTRLTTQDARIELFGGTRGTVSDSGVEFSRAQPGQDVSLTVVPDNGIVFTLVAGGQRVTDAPQQPVAAAETAAGHNPNGIPDPQNPASGQEAPPPAAQDGSTAGERPTGQQDTPANREADERVRVMGRLGRDPSFYMTRSGKRVAKFPLAVPQAEGQTSWHDVVAFDERADELKERAGAGQLGRGNAVEVVGYWHENQKPGKDGALRTVRDLYAASVQKPSPRNGA